MNVIKLTPETLSSIFEELAKGEQSIKAILKDNGIDEKLADEYLAANIAKAFKNPALVPKERNAFFKLIVGITILKAMISPRF